MSVTDELARRSFAVGDRVKIAVDLQRLRDLQDGYGGWNPDMLLVMEIHIISDIFKSGVVLFCFFLRFYLQVREMVGTVCKVNSDGDITVEYP